MTVFNASNDFNTDVSGRLFFVEAPEGTNLSDGPYAIFFIISDTDDDTFSENMKEVYIQFSLFSGASSATEIMNMDTHLATLFKDKIFTVTGWTVVVMRRISGNGPINVPADTEAGTERYWQFDSDYIVILNKN
jgi:hypothetical protein